MGRNILESTVDMFNSNQSIVYIGVTRKSVQSFDADCDNIDPTSGRIGDL